MSTLTARVDDWLDAEVRRFWKDRGVGPSSGFRSIVQEWWALQEFPALEFRDGVTGRRAGIRGGPDVWEVMMVAREVGEEPVALHGHFGADVSPESLRQAVAYAGRFPEPVEAMLEENERIAGMLSGEDAR